VKFISRKTAGSLSSNKHEALFWLKYHTASLVFSTAPIWTFKCVTTCKLFSAYVCIFQYNSTVTS